jgi:ribonuclease-3
LLASLGTTLSSELLELAFTHGSYSREFGGVPTNERLEHLGDSVLELIITGEL